MRVFMFVNNWLGLQVLRQVLDSEAEVVGLAVHPDGSRAFGKEILTACALPESRIFDATTLGVPEVVEQVRGLAPQLGVSILFDYILKRSLIDLFPHGVVNLHPSYLPFNRGQYPNVWSIVDHVPAGVTLHYIDEGVDTGDIIVQRKVPVEITDTGETLYRRLETAGLNLFKETWPALMRGDVKRNPQSTIGGTSHKRRDVDTIDEIELDREYPAGRLLDILRARTFPPYPGAYFVHEGRRIHVRVQLIPEDELGAATVDGRQRSDRSQR